MNLHNLNAWAEEERPDLDEQVQAQDRAAGKRPNSSRLDAESWLRANDPFYGLYYRFCLALGRQPVDWMTWDRWRSRFEVLADWKPRPVPRGHLLPLEVRSKLWPSFEGNLLAAGGFHIVSTGITGQPVGRPPAGIRQPERVRDRMGRLLREDLFEQYVYTAFDYHDPNGKRKKRQLTDLLDVWTAVAKENGVNVEALSRASGVDKRKINKRVKRGLEKRALNAPKGGEQMTNEAAVIAAYDEMRQDGVGYRGPYEENDVIEHIDARFDQLEQKVEDEVSDIFRVLYAFRYGETPAAEWDAYLAERKKGSTP